MSQQEKTTGIETPDLQPIAGEVAEQFTAKEFAKYDGEEKEDEQVNDTNEEKQPTKEPIDSIEALLKALETIKQSRYFFPPSTSKVKNLFASLKDCEKKEVVIHRTESCHELNYLVGFPPSQNSFSLSPFEAELIIAEAKEAKELSDQYTQICDQLQDRLSSVFSFKNLTIRKGKGIDDPIFTVVFSDHTNEFNLTKAQNLIKVYDLRIAIIFLLIREKILLREGEPLSQYFPNGNQDGYLLSDIYLKETKDIENSSPQYRVRFDKPTDEDPIFAVLQQPEAEQLIAKYHELLEIRLKDAIEYIIENKIVLDKGTTPLSKWFQNGNYEGYQFKKVDKVEVPKNIHGFIIELEKGLNTCVIGFNLKDAEQLIAIHKRKKLGNENASQRNNANEKKQSTEVLTPHTEELREALVTTEKENSTSKGCHYQLNLYENQEIINKSEEKNVIQSEDEKKEETEHLIETHKHERLKSSDSAAELELKKESDNNLLTDQQDRTIIPQDTPQDRLLPVFHEIQEPEAKEVKKKEDPKEDYSVAWWLGAFMVSLAALTTIASVFVGTSILVQWDLITKGINNSLHNMSTSHQAAYFMIIPASVFLIVLMYSLGKDALQSPSKPLGTTIAGFFHSIKDGISSLANTLGCTSNQANYTKVI